MVMNIKLKPFLKQLFIPLAVGTVAGFLNRNATKQFNETAVQPAFAPPAWLFPVVWTVLYILMGVSAYIVEENAPRTNLRTSAFAVYYLQLFFNFLWTFIFFMFNAYFFAFIWIIILWLLIIVMITLFYKIQPMAGILQIPYFLWVSFATVLNFAIYRLNR